MDKNSPDSELDFPCRLYVVSPPAIELKTFATEMQEALSFCDIGAFQLRLKDVSRAHIQEAVRVLLPICQACDVAFILNDDVEMAAEFDVDGVHLGQEDMPLKQARDILGDDKVIGISCHDSPHMAMEAGENGADYVAFGAFFPTMSKPPEKLAKYGAPTLEMLRWWSTYTLTPSVAIGGLTPENCVPIVAHGADFVAAISAIWNHEGGAKAGVRAFNNAIKRGLAARSKLPPIEVEEIKEG
jgi:thiamine-phosphate pyrophosphorylase